MIIHSYESSRRADACIEYLKASECHKFINELYLLPIPSSRDNSTILGTNIYINEVIERLKPDSLLVGYGINAEWARGAELRGASVLDVEDDEGFLLENAYLTAVATVGIILTTSTAAPTDMRIGIVGYGRIGRRLAELLLYLGAYVRIYTSKDGVRLELWESGIDAVDSEDCPSFAGLDVLINTAPAVIFNTEERESRPRDPRIIDLASGNNFPSLEGVEKYPSIPARAFPHTAGVAWGRAIEKFVISKHERGDNI